jgi:hypothetical protein
MLKTFLAFEQGLIIFWFCGNLWDVPDILQVEFDQYRLTSVIPIPIPSNRYRYRFEINNKLDIGIGFGIGWNSIRLVSV